MAQDGVSMLTKAGDLSTVGCESEGVFNTKSRGVLMSIWPKMVEACSCQILVV